MFDRFILSLTEADFSNLAGETIVSISGCENGSDEIIIKTQTGFLIMRHEQDCCEQVSIEDITGDPNDLIGAYITCAEVSTSDDQEDVNALWTFYNISTPKGDLCIRWLGSSNGYYGVHVSCYFITEKYLGKILKEKIKNNEKLYRLEDIFDLLSKEDQMLAIFNLDILQD